MNYICFIQICRLMNNNDVLWYVPVVESENPAIFCKKKVGMEFTYVDVCTGVMEMNRTSAFVG